MKRVMKVCMYTDVEIDSKMEWKSVIESDKQNVEMVKHVLLVVRVL